MLKTQDLEALRSMISEAYTILSTTELPQGRAKRAAELLGVSVKLADQLLKTPAAAALGAKGGAKTAERGPDYFRKIAGMRKKRGGGRPRKTSG